MRNNLIFVISICFLFFFVACKKGTVNSIAPAEIANNPYLYKSIDTTRTNIVILGASTAAGKGASPLKYSWARLLQDKLHVLAPKDSLINLAYPGYSTYNVIPTGTIIPTTPSGLSTFIKRPLSDTNRNVNAALKKRPFLVIISLPSNDIAEGYSDAETLNNYKLIINKLKAAKVEYFITSNQPRNLSLNERKRLKLFSTLLLKTFPDHVIDYLDKLGTTTWLYKTYYDSGDGIHPNNKGHEVIYNAFINYAPFKKAFKF